MRRRALLLSCAFAALAAIGGRARAQSVKLQVEQRDLYAGLPFVLSVVAQGFDKDPQPKVEPFSISGCKVTFLGVSPHVSSMVSIINGRRTARQSVTFAYRYRIEAQKPGSYQVPAITVTQGKKKAHSHPATFTTDSVPSTDDMRIELSLPERPVWVGESFDVHIDWYLRRDVSQHTLVVPLFDMTDSFEVHAPESDGTKTLEVDAGADTLELPYEQAKATVGGADYTRIRSRARVTPLKPGRIEISPTRVLAALKIGIGRDSFGFPTSRTRLFKAEDQPRTLEVKPLPVTRRPKSFAGAVGTGFSLDVQADRTVVRVGDPIELRFRVRGSSGLQGLALPPLDRMGLSEEIYSLPGDPPAGEMVDDGQGKLFRVSVRLKSDKVNQIPPLAFSYFDPEEGAFHTVHSQPIALSVRGSAVVGADAVISGGARGGDEKKPAAGGRSTTAIDADFSLSEESDTLTEAGLGASAPLTAALYLLPLLAFAALLWRQRTRGRREAAGELRRAGRELERALADARSQAAVEAAPRIVAALRALYRLAGAPTSELDGFLPELETVAFDPSARDRPLEAALLDRARALGKEVSRGGGRRSAAGAAGAALLLVAAGGLATAPAALARETGSADHSSPASAAPGTREPGDPAAAPSDPSTRASPAPSGRASLAQARAAYKQALETSDRTSRKSGFARAASIFGDLAAEHPRAPALLVDWGNAALGARDLGTAVLAYRRALALDPRNDRARRNLAFVRSTLPDWIAGGDDGGALESLFFWRHSTTVTERHLVAAAAFALAILLCAPWGLGRRRERALRFAAIVPAALWLAMLGSIAVEPDHTADAVILREGETLRSADSPGAPPAVDHPLPAGGEVRVTGERSGWTRLALPGGAEGWVPSGAAARIAGPERR